MTKFVYGNYICNERGWTGGEARSVRVEVRGGGTLKIAEFVETDSCGEIVGSTGGKTATILVIVVTRSAGCAGEVAHPPGALHSGGVRGGRTGRTASVGVEIV